MATETLERPRTGGPGSGVGGNWLVIVLNDDHNTFEHVARTLSNVIPGVSIDQGYRFADKIHSAGQALGRIVAAEILDALLDVLQRL